MTVVVPACLCAVVCDLRQALNGGSGTHAAADQRHGWTDTALTCNWYWKMVCGVGHGRFGDAAFGIVVRSWVGRYCDLGRCSRQASTGEEPGGRSFLQKSPGLKQVKSNCRSNLPSSFLVPLFPPRKYAIGQLQRVAPATTTFLCSATVQTTHVSPHRTLLCRTSTNIDTHFARCTQTLRLALLRAFAQEDNFLCCKLHRSVPRFERTCELSVAVPCLSSKLSV
jgi:hypothetical protein